MNSMRLRELIRSVRACKTASDERSLINRECANIRQGFKENTPYLRTRNMLKLLYIHMLGYPTEFGQLEVVNLISQLDFAGKRIGYLALQLLLDEHDEVLTLSENRMKSDMSSGNPLVQAVAIHAAANVASEDMARDVFDEVMQLIGSSNSYIRRKACLAALRVVRKVPEHAEYFLEAFTTVFAEKHSSTLLCSLTLVNQCLSTPAGQPFIQKYRKLASASVRILKMLVLSSRVTEADVNGITDPFLQVKLLQFMRIIGSDSAVTSEALNDVLAQVITNTDASRNVGCAVHYECVRTIDAIESDEGLRTLAINTIGRFLSSSRDNNLRFVALQTLLDYAKKDLATVQEQQAVILECLRDVDISIRRRALDLSVALVTDSNARLLVPDLLAYLGLCSEEIREDVTLHLCRIIETKSPGDEWRVELSLKVLKVARSHAPLEFAARLLGVISCQTADLQRRAVLSLWEDATAPFDSIQQSKKALLIVALWCVGEYAEHLVESGHVDAPGAAAIVCEITGNSTTPLVKQYGLTALMKLATRYAAVKPTALSIFHGLISSLDCELQQRSREYTALLVDFPGEAAFSFSRMPAIRTQQEDEAVRPVPIVTQQMLQQQTASALDDLFGFGGGEASPESPVSPVRSPGHAAGSPATPASPKSAIDDLFGGGGGGGGGAGSSSLTVAAAAAPAPVQDTMADLFGGAPAAPASPVRAARPEEQVFSCPEIAVFLVGTEFRAGSVSTEVVVRSSTQVPLEDVSCLLATLKSCTLTSSPLSSRVVAPHGEANIHVTVDTSNETKAQGQLKLRVVLSYLMGGERREQQITIATSAA